MVEDKAAAAASVTGSAVAQASSAGYEGSLEEVEFPFTYPGDPSSLRRRHARGDPKAPPPPGSIEGSVQVQKRWSDPLPPAMPLEENEDPVVQDLDPRWSVWNCDCWLPTAFVATIGVFAISITMLDDPDKPLLFIQYHFFSLLINLLVSITRDITSLFPSSVWLSPSLLCLLSMLAHHKLSLGIGMLIDHLSTHVAAAILGYVLAQRRTLLSNKETVKLPLLNDLIYLRLMLGFCIAGFFCFLGCVLIRMDDCTPMELGVYSLTPLAMVLLFCILYMTTILGKAFIGEVGLVFVINYFFFMCLMFIVMSVFVGDIAALITLSVFSLTLSGLLGYSTYAYKNLDKVKPFYFVTSGAT